MLNPPIITSLKLDFTVRPYTPSDRLEWDSFVKESRNGTFLFDRNYMDYHSGRFKDCSWMAYKKGKAVALLPANIDSEGCLHSHQGLTYGGWILPPAHIDGAGLLEIFHCAIEEWRKAGITSLDYKPVPFIYSGQPSEEEQYALFRLGAEIDEINLSSAINLRHPGEYNKLRRRSLKQTSRLAFEIDSEAYPGEFMRLVDKCLLERHNTHPVHTAEEMALLSSRFPENIRMYLLRYQEEAHAGVMIFNTGRVAHAQYIASTPTGRELNLLTPLFHYLISERYFRCDYFDFGISNEDHGRYLNEGLLRQKFSYGATGVAYQRWTLDLKSL